MNTYTLTAKSIAEVKDKITHCQKDHFQPSLCILFSVVEKDLKSLTAIFLQRNIQLFGCTTSGEIAGNKILSDSIVGLLLHQPAL